MTLLAANNMSQANFETDGTSNAYADSDLKIAIDMLTKKLTTVENVAVISRTLTSGSYDREDNDCVSGMQVDNAVFWPLFTKEANTVDRELRIVDKEYQGWKISYWWLWSLGSCSSDTAVVNCYGDVRDSGKLVDSKPGVRPAFH